MIKSKRSGLLVWHKLLLLLAGSVAILTAGLAFAAWQSLGQAGSQIGQNGREILSDQTQLFLGRLVSGQVDTVDLQFAQAQAAAAYGSTILGQELARKGELDETVLAHLWPTLLQQTSNSTTVYFVNPAGQLWAYPPPDKNLNLPADYNLSRQPFFPPFSRYGNDPNNVVWSEVHTNPLSMRYEQVVDAISPVVVNGFLEGYVGVSISLSQLINQFNQRQPIRGSYTFLLDGQKQLVAAPPHARVDLLLPDIARVRGAGDLSRSGNPILDEEIQKMVLGQTSSRQVAIKGELKYLAYQPLNNIDWRLGTVVPVPLATAASAQLVDVVEEGSERAVTGMLIWAGVLLVIVLLVGGMLTRRFTAPLLGLSEVAQSIAGGNLDRRAVVNSRDEIGSLAAAFNIMANRLQGLVAGLEQRILDRTQRLEIVATLGERLSAILDLDELLVEVVNQIKENFGYYHAHIYLLDEEEEKLVVAAVTGQAGAEMKARGHNIALHAPTSLVARAARTAEIVRVDNVRQAEDWLPNPLLPDTYSEMAVPIVLEGQVVGVLDVQEDRVGGLDESDASLLRSLANQVAVAIRNARLFGQVEKALAEARAAQARYLEQAWDRSQVTRRSVGRVQFSLEQANQVSEQTIAEARQLALAQPEPAVVSLNHGEPPTPENQALVAPITLQGIPIGDLQLYGIEGRQWTENDLALVRAVIDQVAQTADSLRLLAETRERANRERTIGRISDKLRRAPDMDTLMHLAVEELSRILGPARTFVRLGTEETFGVDTAANGNASLPEPVEEPLPRTNGSEPRPDGRE